MSLPKPNPFTAVEMGALDRVLSATLEYAQPELAEIFRIARERLQQIQAYLLCPTSLLTLPELRALIAVSSKHTLSLAHCDDAGCDCKTVAHDSSIAVQKLIASMSPELKAAGVTVHAVTRAEFEAAKKNASDDVPKDINAHAAPGRVQ